MNEQFELFLSSILEREVADALERYNESNEEAYGVGKNYFRNIVRPEAEAKARLLWSKFSSAERENLNLRETVPTTLRNLWKQPFQQRLCMLNEAERNDFVHNGFVVLHRYLSDCLPMLRSELARLLQKESPSNSSLIVGKEAINIIQVSQKSPKIMELVQSKMIKDLVTDLIGEDYYLHFDQFFFKPAQSGLGTSWHQDAGYFEVSNPLRAISIWIALDDSDIENGTLEVIPGTHDHLLPHYPDQQCSAQLSCHPRTNDAQAIVARAGTAVAFSYGLIHRTGDNLTPKPRCALALHFMHKSVAEDDLTGQQRQYRVKIILDPRNSALSK